MRSFIFALLAFVALGSRAESVPPPGEVTPPMAPPAEVPAPPVVESKPVPTAPVVVTKSTPASVAAAEVKTPLVELRLSNDFKEGAPHSLFFYSLVGKGIQLGGYCVGANCSKLDRTIGLRSVSKDNAAFYVCQSQFGETLKAGDEVTFDYTVDENTTIYRRIFALNTKDGKSSFSVKEETVVGAGRAVSYATAPTAPSVAPQQGQTYGSGTALDIVNRFRAASGLHALIYHPGLASGGKGGHSPIPSGGRGQCWSGGPSAESAVNSWINQDQQWRGAHTRIVLDAGATHGAMVGGPGNYTLNVGNK